MTIIRHNVNDLPNLCPICGGEAVVTCRCMVHHSSCKNDHHWHTEGWTRKVQGKDGRMYTVETGFKLVTDDGGYG